MNWRRIRKYLAITLLVAITLFAAVSWFVAGALIAPANRVVGPPPSDLPFEDHAIDSESGSTLAVWYAANSDSSATIVLLHPIRGDRRSMLARARLFYNSGFSIVMVDLQAHGESPGKNITIGHLEKHDALAAIEFARSMNPHGGIGVVGCSLGGASTLLADPDNIDALVLESVFPTIAEAVHDRVGIRVGPLKYVLGPALLCQLRPRLGIAPSDLRPIDHIHGFDCPILIATGDLDRHTPLAEAKRMFETASEPKKFVIFKGAGHVDLYEFDQLKYELEILEFLTSNLGLGSQNVTAD